MSHRLQPPVEGSRRETLSDARTGLPDRAAVAILVVHVALMAASLTRQFPTIDEPRHLAAGLAYWHCGEFDLDRGNPPLVGLVAAIPVLFAEPATDWSDWPNTTGVACDFAAANRTGFLRLMHLARLAGLPWSLLGAWVVYTWGKECFGPWPGVLALSLWCGSPLMLGHGQLVTSDVAAASLTVATVRQLDLWRQDSSWRNSIRVGLVLGLAQLAKFACVALYPLLLLAVVWPFSRTKVTTRCRGLRATVAVVLSVVVINLGYAFDGSFHSVSTLCRQLPLRMDVPPEVAWIPVPLPEDYVAGICEINDVASHPQWSYLHGRWSRSGWWHYYLSGLLVKLPLGTLALASIGAGLLVFDVLRGNPRWLAAALLGSCLLIIAFVTVVTLNFQHHLRYALPAIPFLYLCAARCAAAGRTGAVITLIGAVASTASSLAVYPHSLSYFNELAGGPLRGHEHLAQTSIDLGQDLLYFRRWLALHPEVDSVSLEYSGGLDASFAGVAAAKAPSIRQWPHLPPGWYAANLRVIAEPNAWTTAPPQPVARAGYSIWIYHLPDPADVGRSDAPVNPTAPSRSGSSAASDAGPAADLSADP